MKREATVQSLHRVRPSLEELESRLVPSQAMTPPSFFQAAASLYRDGAELALIQQHMVNFPEGIGTSGTFTIFGLTAPQVQADIAFNMPYAQPFSGLLVMSAETAVITAFANGPAQHAAYVQANSFL
jgi:hypothetical protein